MSPTMVHVGNKGIIDGLWKSEKKCIGPRAKDADEWIMIWAEIHRVHQEDIPMEVEHVKAHRSKKETQEMSIFEKTDELAKEGAMMDGGDMAQVRAIMV